MPPKKEASDELAQVAESPEEAKHAPVTPQPTKTYHFPDIDGGGKAVAIEAASIDEAQALYRKQKGNA